MDELYKRFGQLVIQAEIIQNQINEVKRQIAEGLNKQAQGEQKDEPK